MAHRYSPGRLALAALTLALALAAAAPLAHAQPGTFVGWGRHTEGQISSPAGLSDIASVSFGAYHSLALTSGGTVVGWGYSEQGRTAVPAGLSNVVAVSAGGAHSLALKSDGTVVAWGNNDYGQATVPAGLTDVVALSTGGSAHHSLAVKSDGTVVGWGNNDFGLATVPAGLSNVVAVSAGLYHSLALKSDGTVAGWGIQGPPVGLADVVAISVGRFHSLALTSDGTVVSWGDNFYGQTAVPSGLTDVAAIGAGEFHSLVLVQTALPVEVAFAVDTSFETLAPGEVVGVRGGTAPLGWESTTPLSDDDGDNVWTGTVAFPAAAAGSTLEYKFVHHAAGDDPASADLGAAGGFEGDVGVNDDGDPYANRRLTLPSEGTVLPVAFWNNLVLCSTDAPFAVSAFDLVSGGVTLANGSATEQADLADCTLVVFDPVSEAVTDAAVSTSRLEPGAAIALGAALPAGPGAFALVEGPAGPGTGVSDVLGRVVAAVVYGTDGSVYGACGNGAGVRPCASPEAQATLAAALAAAFGGGVAGEDGPDAALLAVWPNPSTGATRVAFGLGAAGAARVSVYDALGREVAVVAAGSYPAGTHEASLDASALPAGVYVVRSVTADGARTARLTVAR